MLKVARSAFTSLFSIAFDTERDIDLLPETSRRFILDRSEVIYNLTYQPNERLSQVALAAFESILLASQVIQESIDESGDLSDGRQFTRRFWNRTFNLPTGQLYINENGDRFPDIILRQWDAGKAVFETAMLFRSAERQLNVSRPEGVVWQGGTVPLNEPVCGFTGKNPICQPSGISRTSLILAALGGLAALALVIGLVTRIVLRHLIDQASEKWWQLTNVNVRFENWPTGTPMDDGSIEADASDENLMENDPKSFPRWQPVLY
ncbi:hypothetical protein BV898_14227 [Hypsibius exemplaris]|uniref:Receptor ligand binding region domain-containing protein n=1 Tax=Hypsibius exemplaris TaxID=2072580 RepID=A0A1W0W8H0_HYPEX|nr:hypothetical protein BV898_14227 [Hypsibius exemplaris]